MARAISCANLPRPSADGFNHLLTQFTSFSTQFTAAENFSKILSVQPFHLPFVSLADEKADYLAGHVEAFPVETEQNPAEKRTRL
jgi:hypothetical protein